MHNNNCSIFPPTTASCNHNMATFPSTYLPPPVRIRFYFSIKLFKVNLLSKSDKADLDAYVLNGEWDLLGNTTTAAFTV